MVNMCPLLIWMVVTIHLFFNLTLQRKRVTKRSSKRPGQVKWKTREEKKREREKESTTKGEEKREEEEEGAWQGERGNIREKGLDCDPHGERKY